MPSKKTLAPPGQRCHIVLVPGFGGFDALGRVEYYAGITRLFQQWKNTCPVPVVLHYFDNLPTAAVVTRAARLRGYLAKRIARREILAENDKDNDKNDKLVLVGHSTGGLDIRQLVYDLHNRDNRTIYVDGSCPVPAANIRNCIRGVVFLSVPHWGTNIADWVYSHCVLRKVAIADLRAAVAGSQFCVLDEIETRIAGAGACLTGSDLLLAARDALTEANEHFGDPSPTRTAEAQEAASELALYFRHMCSDFRVINDLTSQPHDGDARSPAHFNDLERKAELALWRRPTIRTLSYATVGARPFDFAQDHPAPTWELTNPCTWPEIGKNIKVSNHTDFLYRLCYRACAGGPFDRPDEHGRVTRVLGPASKDIEVWDNDGIVNTASMLWPPNGDVALVAGDHLDIVGHFEKLESWQAKRAKTGHAPSRLYQSYNSFKSASGFTRDVFETIWKEIFDFAIA